LKKLKKRREEKEERGMTDTGDEMKMISCAEFPIWRMKLIGGRNEC
jgi:hypothetical protein